MSDKPEVLLLAHRIPYPPNKGDKLRSFHILSQLRERYRVHLGCFVDDPADWAYESEVEALCESACFIRIEKSPTKFRALRSLAERRAISVCHFDRPELHAWVRETLASKPIVGVLTVSSPMAQYVLDTALPSNVSKVIDYVDLDSEKWRDYGAQTGGVFGWVYRREARLLGAFERTVAEAFDWGLFVSDAEANVFRQYAPAVASKVLAIENGVDQAFFCPSESIENPFALDEEPLVFTGAMDYAPNVQAVTWFAEKVFPRVQEACSNAAFYIVGLSPADEVQALAAKPGVHVTGRVPDVRPYLQYARAAVAPMMVARGVQNKVLEALAMGQTVLATPFAAEGIHAEALVGVTQIETAEAFADAAIAELRGAPSPDEGAAIRDSLIRHYDWERNLSRLVSLLGAA